MATTDGACEQVWWQAVLRCRAVTTMDTFIAGESERHVPAAVRTVGVVTDPDAHRSRPVMPRPGHGRDVNGHKLYRVARQHFFAGARIEAHERLPRIMVIVERIAHAFILAGVLY
jgi:hypothetical protein